MTEEKEEDPIDNLPYWIRIKRSIVGYSDSEDTKDIVS